MIGTIVKVVKSRGFAFLRDPEGNDRFVHADSMEPLDAFAELQLGTVVDFVPMGIGKRSLRADHVKIVENVVDPVHEEDLDARIASVRDRFAPKIA
jgi:cold shock CspA family protein